MNLTLRIGQAGRLTLPLLAEWGRDDQPDRPWGVLQLRIRLNKLKSVHQKA